MRCPHAALTAAAGLVEEIHVRSLRRFVRPVSGELMVGAALPLLAGTSTISDPVARADESGDPLNALMMGGSGMPKPSEFWRDTVLTDYINPATGGNYTSVLVPTPESIATTSNSEGLADLQAAMAHQELTDPGQSYLIEGYSQSAAISVLEKEDLMATGQHPDATLLLLGSLNRPDGGIYERFPGLDVPGLGGFFAFNGAEPTDAGIPTIDIVNQYDFFADFPQFPINPIADLNALFGIIYAHAAYADGPLAEQIPAIWPPSDPLPPVDSSFADQYILGSTQVVQQVDGDTTFYFVPTTDLPLLDPLHSLGVPESVLNIFQPALQVLVEAGYDRSIPFGDPTPAELIPTLDPVTFSLEFENGVVQGANNALELFGTQLPDFAQIETDFAAAEQWSETNVGVPYDQVIGQLNTDFNPFTAFTAIEGPLGQDIQNLLDITGIQQDLLNPVLGLLGTLGALFTS
jgi:PE-PPE domain